MKIVLVKTSLPDVKELLKSNKPLNRDHFIYHSEQDYYECPTGHRLLLKIKLKQKNKYQSDPEVCINCALHSLCFGRSNKSGIRTILRSHREKYVESMYLKLQTDEAKSRMKSRATSVEPVFGNLKSNIGFRRFNLRGLQKVKGEFTLMCIAHNINKLFQFSGGGGCLAPAVVPTPVQNAERDLPLRRALRILEGIYIRKLVFDRRRPSEKCKYLV